MNQEQAPRNLLLDLRVGESLQMPGGVVLQFKHKKGQVARFCVLAPEGADVKKMPARTQGYAPSHP